jgi:NAD(P)-dependent dehydrogenase (short-subunit alcohol dehydrogenase family)
MKPMLENKVAIIYGGGGFLGRGVARRFAQEGAVVYLAGRTEKTLEAAAGEIAAAGGRVRTGVVDACDERAVQDHLQAVIDEAGAVDVSFNLTTRGDVQGTRLLDMSVDDYLAPIVTGARSNFITARAAARRMVERGSGVILMVTSGSGGAATPPEVWAMGGTGPADAATETFMRYLAVEVGPRGVRVACLWTAGAKDLAATGLDPGDQQMEEAKDRIIASASMLRRRPTVQQLADTAAFIASDQGSGITASIVNVNSGLTSH